MIKRFAGAAAALVASVLSTAPTMAWDSFGHMEVAAVAWDQMTPKARDRAITLIKLNPNFNEWVVHGVPAVLRELESRVSPLRSRMVPHHAAHSAVSARPARCETTQRGVSRRGAPRLATVGNARAYAHWGPTARKRDQIHVTLFCSWTTAPCSAAPPQVTSWRNTGIRHSSQAYLTRSDTPRDASLVSSSEAFTTSIR